MVVQDPVGQRLLTGNVVEGDTQRLAIDGEMELGGWPTERPGKPANFARDCAGTIRSLPEDVVPLGYVITVDHRDLIRRKLVHWQLPTEVTRRDFPAAHRIAARALMLPIDQRYDGSSMGRIADALLRIL